MKICLDLRTAGTAPHGIARYGVELTRALAALGTPHRWVVLANRGSDLGVLGQAGATVVRCLPRPYRVEEQLLMPFVVARLRPDLYHCPTYSCPLFVPVPALFTLHDLLPLEYPQDFSLGLRLYCQSFVRGMARRARRIVTVSSYTRSSICRRFSLSPRAVRVIPEGGDHIRRQAVSHRDDATYGKINPGDLDYFLSIANPRPHKNILFSVRCFLGSEKLREGQVRYVLVGRQHPSVYAYVKAMDAQGRIRFAGEVTEGLLVRLYERAVALLCPSRGEGFCLPAAEAMHFGLPVIAARDGALPEVLGATGLLLALEDIRGWQDAMESIYARRRQGDWNAAPVLERAGRFTWANAAEQTLALYEEVDAEGNASDR
jgi:glycosyltransferase involved in cell wall biosynthesis